jgi:WS/DGAT/MGAT family acyltransferase
MSKLKLADAFFLLNESRRTPMHVAGLNLFSYPEGVNEQEYIQELKELLHYDVDIRPPYDQILKMGPLGAAGPVSLVKDKSFDIDYHISVSALPRPGRYRELFELVSRLHSTLLDRERPLWEFHIIEGLENRQFATYFKVHHCVVDGVAAIHFMNSMMSRDPKKKIEISPFSMQTHTEYREQVRLSRARNSKPSDAQFLSLTKRLVKQVENKTSLAKALGRHAMAFLKPTDLSVPWARIPATPANRSIEGARRFVAQSWSFQRVRAMSKAHGGTLNDGVLAMCGGAIRFYFLERGILPKEPLKALVPVSVREDGDLDSGNAIAFIVSSLATDIPDASDRIQAIKASMAASKQNLSGMSKSEIDFYSTLTQAPVLLTNLLSIAGKLPMANTVVSNVPGPREQMYWHGAKLEGVYPVSVPLDGVSVNITLVSNHDSLDFGITACRRSAPHIQRIIDYMDDALVELEAAVGIEFKEVQSSKRAKKTVSKKSKVASEKSTSKRKKKVSASKS